MKIFIGIVLVFGLLMFVFFYNYSNEYYSTDFCTELYKKNYKKFIKISKFKDSLLADGFCTDFWVSYSAKDLISQSCDSTMIIDSNKSLQLLNFKRQLTFKDFMRNANLNLIHYYNDSILFHIRNYKNSYDTPKIIHYYIPVQRTWIMIDKDTYLIMPKRT